MSSIRTHRSQLERSLDDSQRLYSIDAGFLLPSAVSIRALGLLKQRGSEWSSAVRVRYGVQEDSQNMQECHVTQKLHSESDPVQTYHITAAHELHCSHFLNLNHKIHLKHERSPIHVQSSLDVSYGKQWNQSSNKHRILFNQSLRNQSEPGLTSYAVELSLRLLDRGLNYRTQLLHSYFKKHKSESSTHLKINYNNQMPLVAGLHWKDVSTKTSLQKWEGSFNMDTPWLYVYIAQKLTQPQRGITQFSSEVTTRKLVNMRSVTLEGFYKDRGKERQGRLHLFTPTASYIKVGGWNMLGKRGVKASCSISTAWTPALHGQISVVNGKQVKTLEISAGYGKQDLNISAVLSTLDKKLKKRLLMMTMTLSDLKNPYAELQMEGAIEEIRKEKKIYQKRWKLNFRQPFKFLPQSLILQETFTSHLHQKVYTLESKVFVHGNKKVIHVLTLGFQPQQPYVCSSIVQSFSTERIPQDSKICVTVQNHQTAYEIQGRLWTGNDEILAAFGQVQLHDLTTSQQGITVKANLSQLFQLDFPTSVSLHIEVLRSHRNNSEFEYHSEGNVAIDDNNYHANAAITVSPFGNISSSISLKANEKNATLHFTLDNKVAKGINTVCVHAGFHQTLFPGVTSDGHIHLAANSSSESVFLQCTVKKEEETFNAHFSGTLPDDQEWRISLSADIFNSIQDLAALPNSASLVGVLTQSKGLTEGELTVVVDDAVYGLEVTRQHDSKSGEDRSTLLCLVAMEESLCVNININLTHCGCRSLHTQLSHSFPWLRSAGLPLNSSAGVYLNWNGSSVCAQLTLHAGASGPTATLEQSSHHSSQTTGCSQVNCTEGIDTGHLLGVCSGHDQEDSLKVGIRAGLYNSQRSAFSFDLQGHQDISSIGLMVNISHNISALHTYLPSEFHLKSQLSHTRSSVKGTAELLVGVSGLAFEAEISSTNSGFKQVLMFNHSIPQLHLLPRNLALRTRYGGKRGSHTLTHRAQWENQDLTQTDGVTQLQSYPELSGKTQGWGLDLRVENDIQKKLGDLSVDWILFGRHDQVRVQGSWTLVSRKTDSLEQKQPFISTLTHFHIHSLSHGPGQRHDSNNQAHLSWEHGKPINVSVTVSEHWHNDLSRGQACIFLSPGQIQSLLPLVEMEGCVAVAQEGEAYSQNTELKWKDKRITQSMKYQEGVKGMHTLLVEVGAQNVSPSPCPSHSLLTQIHTNLRDRLEHHVQIGLCPPQPALIWSGSHRVNSGKELLYTHTRVSVSGHPQHNTFTMTLRNISSSQRSNYSLITEWRVGNWSVELACSSLSSGRNVVVQGHAKLDRSEMLWMQGALGKRCLRAAAGYDTEMSDEIRVVFCSEGHHWFTLEAQRGGRGIENESLTLISVGAANQSLLFQAKGCRECLWAAEARLQQLGSRIRSKLLDRVQRLQHLLLTFRRQAGDSMFLLELSEGPLSLTQQAETLLLQRAGVLWKAWTTGLLRHTLTHSLPHTLHVLHLISQQVQQELRKPLATLAGAYHDVTGVRLDMAWQQGVQLWTRELTELLPAILHDPQLRAPSLTALHVAIFAIDMVGQQTFQWMEARSAAMLVGIRRQLAIMYKFSKSEGEVIFRVPLPVGPWLKVEEAGVTEVLLEEFVMKPLLALNSVSPTAELYRLKRRIMDSPVNYQAFLVEDVYLVSFDGHLLKLPASCDFILAADVIQHTFSIVLKSDRFKRRSLVVQMQNTKIAIHPNGEVEVNCQVAHIPYTNREVAIRKDVNLIEVSNERGLRVSCDPQLEVCSVILDGWLHGVSTGLLGTNDNEAANELLLPDGSHTNSVLQFTHSWQVDSECVSRKAEVCQNGTADSLSCTFLFSSANSPLSPCFRVVDPVQFMMKCEGLECVCDERAEVSRPSFCTLASAYIHQCHRNYVPLELPVQCV
uniref:Si:dkeyp-106c3.1 n=1 Tax=Cyprinus carpio carpio TaxID=630221 RepID=A0A9J7Z687_CYPCA